MRILKKYPNRRLYDTQQSEYVTLDDVRRVHSEFLGSSYGDIAVVGDVARDSVRELARRLFEHGGIDAIHVYDNMITVDLSKGATDDGLLDVIRELAERLGCGEKFAFETPREVFAEFLRATAGGARTSICVYVPCRSATTCVPGQGRPGLPG